MHVNHWRFGTLLISGVVLSLVGVYGCGTGKSINCDVVRLQREAGRSTAEIAAGMAASEAEVAKCGEGSAPVGKSTASEPPPEAAGAPADSGAAGGASP